MYKRIDNIVLWNIKDHLIKLDSLIGMEKLKESIFQQILYFIQGMHIRNREGEYLHTRIVGPPGTGKTTVANILSDIYSDLGILKKGNIKLAHREDFIAGYIGQTAIKTTKLLKSCIGGVLFYDEGYSMGSNRDDDSFAKEAVDTLVSFLSEHKSDFCFIIAGYEEDIEKYFFSMNKGLERRIPWCHKIDKYTPEDLANICLKMIRDMNWETVVSHTELSDLIRRNEKLYFKNAGGDIENFLTNARIVHANRVFTLEYEFKFKLTLEDFGNAINMLEKNNPKTEDLRHLSFYS
jgi:replication-associated recombination protein RarA